jgi:Anti-sigma factor NepR
MNEDEKPGRPAHMQTETTQRKPRGRLGREVQNKIGQQLRAMYDDVVNSGVPDRFVEMLRKLDEQKNGDPEKGSAS